jgi:hypothetical protein
MRGDVFRKGTATALDVIPSPGEDGELVYGLKWRESIGSADVVKCYFVEGIDSDASFGRCGFVYEEGSARFRGFAGNHIHLPADTEVLNSPECVEFFWIRIRRPRSVYARNVHASRETKALFSNGTLLQTCGAGAPTTQASATAALCAAAKF